MSALGGYVLGQIAQPASLKHLSVSRPPHGCSWNEVCLMSSCLQGSTHHMHVLRAQHYTSFVAVSQSAVKR